MAAQAEIYVPTVTAEDRLENRPKNDQAIVLPIQKDIPNREYVKELYKHINNEDSFLYVSRISRERLCVVFEKAEQATFLVESVRFIEVNNTQVPLSYLVAKSVKVIISNAGFCITNSQLKRYLTQKRGIRTASSVSEYKASNLDFDQATFNKTRCFRRVVYIHPDDVDKLPTGPVKFDTPEVPYWVFFERDIPKCFICANTGHFKDSCPTLLNNDNSDKDSGKNNNIGFEVKEDKNKNSEKIEESEKTVNTNASELRSLEDGKMTNSTGASAATSGQAQLTDHMMEIVDTQKTTKRALSTTSGDSTLSNKPEVSLSKKFRTVEKKETENLESKLAADLKLARVHIEGTKDKHLLNFDEIVDLMVKTAGQKPSVKIKIARSMCQNIDELIILLNGIYSLVEGRGIKRRITTLKKTLENYEDNDLINEINNELSAELSKELSTHSDTEQSETEDNQNQL